MVDTFKIKTKAPAEGREQGAAVKKKKKSHRTNVMRKMSTGFVKGLCIIYRGSVSFSAPDLIGSVLLSSERWSDNFRPGEKEARDIYKKNLKVSSFTSIFPNSD